MVRASLLVAVAALVGTSVHAKEYVTQEDEALLEESRASVEMRCAEDTRAELDRDDSYQALLDVLGGSNFIVDAIKESSDEEDFQTRLNEELSVSFFIERGLAIVLGFLSLICCIFCWSWSTCSCCRKCRIFDRAHEQTRKCKMGVGVLMLVCGILVIVGTVMTFSGSANISDGYDTMLCAGSELLDTTLGGSPKPYFIGMMPVLGVIGDLDRELNTGSGLLNDISGLMNSTKSIEDSVLVASRTLAVLGDMLKEPKTVLPETTANGDLMHECVLCLTLGEAVTEASTALESSVASALVKTRSVVDEKLSEDERDKLQIQLRDSASPLIGLKGQVADAFRPFVKKDSVLDDIRGYIDSYLLPITGLYAVWAIIYFLLGTMSVFCWVFFERTTKGGERVYSRSPHRIACCTMCFTIPCFVFPVFVFGGLLTGLFTVTAAACDTLVQFDGSLIMDFSRVMGTNISSDIVPLVDACIAGTDGPNPNIMDIVMIQMNDTEPKEPAADVLRKMIFAPLDGAFSGIDAAVDAAGNLSIADNPGVVDLRALLRANGIDSMMLPDGEKISQAYPSLALEESLRTQAVTSSCSCDEHTVSEGLGDLSGETIPGIQDFVDALSAFGTVSDDTRAERATDCTDEVVCDGTNDLACEDGNSYVVLKREVLESVIYRCDLFENEDGSTCDPLSMTKVNGVWTRDCLLTNSDGSKYMVQKEIYCNLVDFATYVRDFDDRIGKVMARVADTSDEVLGGIKVEMGNIIQTRILDPVEGIIEGIACGFLINAYRNVIDGLCYQTAIGISHVGRSYVIFGSAMLIMSLVLYFSWRVEVDNVNSELDSKKQGAQATA